jgi:hypothetical protein
MFPQKSVVGMLAVTVCLGVAGAGKPASSNQKATGQTQPSISAFERLKGLAGDWQSRAPADETQKNKTVARYRVTAAGSAVVETLFPGEDKEMVTIYHRDGDQLLLTHYCACGNQPRMRTTACDSRDELSFEFAGGNNLDPAKDLHMHGYRVRFVDGDHIHGEWEYYQGGKSAGKHAFDLVRQKP